MAIIPKKIGTKKIMVVPEERGLNKWFERPATTEPTLPMKGALSVYDSIPSLTKKAPGSLAFIGKLRNDVQNAGAVFACSGCYGDGHGFSILPINYGESMAFWAATKLVDPSWHNNRDQFMQPNCALPEEFITDSAVWDLFHNSNSTSALKDVEYKGKKWQVRNQFFPYPVEWLRSLESMPQEVFSQLRTAKDTFVATWLNGRTLSPEAQALLDAGRKVYEAFYREYANLNRTKFKLSYWDAGWYQIRNALLDAGKGLVELNAVKIAHNKLRDKLRPKVYEYGFLSPEIMYE